MTQVRTDSTDRFATKIFMALLLVGLYYMSYRYPFSINSSITSPTYADTPLFLQVGKYLILALIAMAAVVASERGHGNRRRILREPRAMTVVGMAILAATGIVKGLTTNNQDLISLSVVFFVGLACASMAESWHVDPLPLGKIVSVFAIIAVLFDGVQLALFYGIGRLPALAYTGSVSVRFGSVLDDPNGYALLVALMLPVAWIRWKGRTIVRVLLAGGLIYSLIITQSFTGISAVTVAVGIALFVRFRKAPSAIVFLAWGGMIGAVVLYFYLNNSTFFSDLLVSKSGSFASHSASLDTGNLGWVDLIGMGTDSGFRESTYLSLLFYIGIPGLVLYIGLGIVAAVRLTGLARSLPGTRGAIYWGFLVFTLAYLIGGLNMHFSGVFPVDLLYAVGIAVSVFTPMPAAQGTPTNQHGRATSLTTHAGQRTGSTRKP